MAAAAEGAAMSAAGGCFKACGAVSRCVGSCCTLFGSWIKHLPAPVVGAILRVFNIGNAVLLGACAYFSYQVVLGDVTKSFLATYMFIFGCLLLLVRGGGAPPSPLFFPPSFSIALARLVRKGFPSQIRPPSLPPPSV
jgi:hypothetical protein